MKNELDPFYSIRLHKVYNVHYTSFKAREDYSGSDQSKVPDPYLHSTALAEALPMLADGKRAIEDHETRTWVSFKALLI